MANPESVAIDVGDITLAPCEDREVVLGALPGVQVLVLLRHRH